ncbi:Transcription factor SRM1 [Phytophthora citrophthora]|uniref:Transcription factor SRM1 n=1 Tax=Phytophthora citrophthora TaxID=4793 RepID=A0AAD9G4Q8_9STRA|nr:Transcription factor SRM1 [Phytophthora citrophthora]
MTITESTRRQLFKKTNGKVIRMDQKRHAAPRAMRTSTTHALGTWTEDEHRLFFEALELYPSGPWKRVAQYVGTRTPRQVMTHAQKYRQRLQRFEENTKAEPVETKVSCAVAKEVQTDAGKVLSVVVSPMQIPVPPAGATGEMQIEASICMLPPRPDPFMDDPPAYGHFPLFDVDLDFLTQLANDPIFDSLDMTLPGAELEPLQL